MNLLQTFNQYEQYLKQINKNRKSIVKHQEENRGYRERIKYLKDDIVRLVKEEIAAGKNIHQICKEWFGKIDGRYKIIITLFK